MHDVFISYEHESKSIADNICAVLEQNKIRCWYAPRDVIGDYATSIVEAIGNAKVFVLVLNENSSNSQHCLNEVEVAYKSNIEHKNNVIIMPFRVDNRNLSMAMEYYVKRLHWIDAANCSLEQAIEELKTKVSVVVAPTKTNPNNNGRLENKYFSDADSKEKRRLAVQRKLLKTFDQEVYDRLLDNKSDICVLDVGSNNGDLIMDRVGGSGKAKTIIGLEYDLPTVEAANKKHAPKAQFYHCDVESEQFSEIIDQAMADNQIDAFDVINCSMLFLHLKNPYKVLKELRKRLKPGGSIFIRDIDDGFNFAYPDNGNCFERIYRICSQNETAGFRQSGRQIFTLLSNCGFKNIKLEKLGLNTSEMEYDEREALFDTYFSFILEDLKIMHERYPEDARIKEDLEWFTEQYDDLERAFQNKSFLFSLGFIILTAQA